MVWTALFMSLCYSTILFLSGFISSLPQLAWEKRLCCCCCCCCCCCKAPRNNYATHKADKLIQFWNKRTSIFSLRACSVKLEVRFSYFFLPLFLYARHISILTWKQILTNKFSYNTSSISTKSIEYWRYVKYESIEATFSYYMHIV